MIPLPPVAWDIVQRARELTGGSEWLFPGKRPRRAGGEVKHIDPTLLTQTFAGIPDCQASPHDIRRAFATTYATRARLRLGEVKLDLDHSDDVPAGDVTVAHYRFDPCIGEKKPIVEGWCASLASMDARKS